jgi:circadian clock protein KaiB
MAKLCFHIFIAGKSSRNEQLVRHYQEACQALLDSHTYELTIIELLREPQQAERHKILATPTICRTNPAPEKRIIGNFSAEGALQALRFLTEDINHTRS